MAKAKEIEGLDCNGDAFFNVDLILRTRFEEMCALKAKALEWTDIEGVHDMRVASRRLRSVLRDFAPYFSESKAPRKQLREIARALGAVRDEDVAIIALKKLRRKAGKEASAGIKLLIEERRTRQGLARAQLVLAISDDAVNQLQEKFAAWLQSEAVARIDNSKESSAAVLTFRAMAREVILSQYGELDNLSHSLYSPFDVEPLHRMRIAAKRLRYSLELFSHCFGDALTEFAKEIAGLQTSLGELHDCDVWIDDLGVRLGARDGDVPGHNLEHAPNQRAAEDAASLRLLQHFVKARTRHYSDALSRWSEWKAANFYSRLGEHLQEPLQSPASLQHASSEP
jgi:CHAD domain-containing protein